MEAQMWLFAIRSIAYMLDDNAKIMTYSASVRSKIDDGNAVY